MHQLVERHYTAPLFPVGRGCSDGRSGRCYETAVSVAVEGEWMRQLHRFLFVDSQM